MANSDESLPVNTEITSAIKYLHLDVTSPRAVATLIRHFCIVNGIHSRPQKAQSAYKNALKSHIIAAVSEKYAPTNTAGCRFLC